MYRVEGELPALRVQSSGKRFLGIHSERGYGFRGLAGCRKETSKWHTHNWQHMWSPDHFAFWLEGIERYTQYLRF